MVALHSYRNWRLLISSMINLPWVIVGDFNATKFKEERSGAPECAHISHEFNNFIDSLALIKINPTFRRFIWSNFRHSISLAKLDRYFMTLDWHKAFLSSILSPSPQETSEHISLLLSSKVVDYTSGLLRKPFCFENIRYSYEGFGKRIKEWWNESPSFEEDIANMDLKLRCHRANFRKWSKAIMGNIIERKHCISYQINDLDEIQEQRLLSMVEWKTRADLKQQLDSLPQQKKIL